VADNPDFYKSTAIGLRLKGTTISDLLGLVQV